MFTIAPGTRAFGMQLPVQAQSNYFVADWERSAGPAEMARIARLCDEHEWERATDYIARLTTIAIAPSYPRDGTLFAGSRGYWFRSTNGGGSWEALSPAGLLESRLKR